MKKSIAIIFVVLMMFSGCNTRTDTSQPDDISEPIQSSSTSSSQNTYSNDENSEILNDESSQQSDLIPTLPENQSSNTSSIVPSSAAPTQAIIEPTIETVFIELGSNSIKKDEISISLQIPYKIYNNSSGEIHSSPSYVIEKYTGADWIPFPFNELEQPNWPSVVYSLPAGGTFDENMSYWAFEEDMTPGTYRLVKYAGEEGKDWIPLYAKFSVTE